MRNAISRVCQSAALLRWLRRTPSRAEQRGLCSARVCASFVGTHHVTARLGISAQRCQRDLESGFFRNVVGSLRSLCQLLPSKASRPSATLRTISHGSFRSCNWGTHRKRFAWRHKHQIVGPLLTNLKFKEENSGSANCEKKLSDDVALHGKSVQFSPD